MNRRPPECARDPVRGFIESHWRRSSGSPASPVPVWFSHEFSFGLTHGYSRGLRGWGVPEESLRTGGRECPRFLVWTGNEAIV